MYKEVNTDSEVRALLVKGRTYTRLAFQDVDFGPVSELAQECWFSDCIFLGGNGINSLKSRMDDKCLVFPSFKDIPYNTFRNSLYNASSLYEGYISGEPESYADSFDAKVYDHYLKTGKLSTGIRETLARFLHDHAMTDAVNDFISGFDEKSIAGLMGGHGLSRTDATYRKVAIMSKHLTEQGCLMVSGGGPGAMEATHLGAWLAGREDETVDESLQILSAAPEYNDRLWLETAFKVMSLYPSPKYVSLGVPTWLYGHEPATPFATHIAKYFENSKREDIILTIAKGGIIYSPGSAGTMQEIFQDAVQNHYLSFGYSSPMIFFGKDYWTEEMPVYPLMQYLCGNGKYRNLLISLTDSTDEAVRTIISFKNSEKRDGKEF